MSNYTNTSLEPVGDLYGEPIQPCVKSGYCCKVAPCMFGEWNATKTACKHLAEPNDIGQRDCLRYQWIIENVPGYEYYPAFGAGCSSVMFNIDRKQVIEQIKQLND